MIELILEGIFLLFVAFIALCIIIGLPMLVIDYIAKESERVCAIKRAKMQAAKDAMPKAPAPIPEYKERRKLSVNVINYIKMQAAKDSIS